MHNVLNGNSDLGENRTPPQFLKSLFNIRTIQSLEEVPLTPTSQQICWKVAPPPL